MESRRRALVGLVNAVSAYLIWGLSPIYFKTLKAVPAFEILMHRMVWSFLFLLPFLFFNGRWSEFVGVFRKGRHLGALLITTLLVGFNWFLFIWAINHDHVLQTSLGYYINPLVNVLLGVVILGERLRPAQLLAVALAAVAVLNLVLSFGEIPWVSLGLALSFSCYGLIRKVVPVSSIVGPTVETFLLMMLAIGYLAYAHRTGSGTFLQIGMTTDILLISAALVTAVPLILFTRGARRLHFFNNRLPAVHRAYVHLSAGRISLEGAIGVGPTMDLYVDLDGPGHLLAGFGPVLPGTAHHTTGRVVTFSPRS